jgi:glycosyltransferase involved in cell wall biosynthesis
VTAPVSAIVPTFNRAGLVRQTVAAILSQTSRPDEVIVIDDGSTDETPSVLASFGSAITARRTPNGGTVRARLAGLALARHERIAFCDHDDLWRPDHVARHLALHEAVPGMDMSFSDFRLLREAGPDARTKFDHAPAGFWERHAARRLPEGWVIGPGYLEESFRFTPIFPSALMLTKTLLARAGGLDVSRTGNRAEDGDFISRCLLTATLGAIPEATVQIRDYDGNYSADTTLGLLDEVDNLLHLLATRSEFEPYRAVMEDEIRIRRVQAAERAFASGDHALVRRIVRAIPPAQRPGRLRVKHAAARLPDPAGRWANRLLQSAARLKPKPASGAARER